MELAPDGALVEGYTIIRELGRGGMGVVYLATDNELGDQCAIKLLHPDLAKDEQIAIRFHNEARAAAAIKHAAIVQIRGVGRCADGRGYYVMEYLEGVTLAQYCAARGPLSLVNALEIVAPLCEALDKTHAGNIIHRDLKPENIIVIESGGSVAPKILDFGVAKLTNEPPVTHPGASLGTGAYMAPEQVRGGAIDRRSDVYSLGVMVYGIVTGGALPYDAPTNAAYYHHQMTQQPISPHARHGAVSTRTAGAILAAIHVDPEQRPKSAGAFLRQLLASLRGDETYVDAASLVRSRAPLLMRVGSLDETIRARDTTKSWKYELGPRLGQGGMAEVYRATIKGSDGFTVPVAIKRILPELAQAPHFVEAFKSEARIVSLLEHPNVVKVFDYDRDPEGRLYIAMEYVDGVDLDRLRRTGLLPVPVVIFVITEILEGLSYAHHLPVPGALSSAEEIAARASVRGLIHRDMSHHNVMVSWHGAVKVMDFGIAKLRAGHVAEASMMLRGKPAYMSPEQANTAVPLDERSDLFAVGIMLWELLTGQNLFERESIQQVLWALLMESVPRPSHAVGNVPADVEAVTMKLLERDPEMRFRSAQDVIAALNACEQGSRASKGELKRLLLDRFPDTAARPLTASVPSATLQQAGAPSWTGKNTQGSSVEEVFSPRSPVRRHVAAVFTGIAVAVTAVVVALVIHHLKEGAAPAELSVRPPSEAAPVPSADQLSAPAPRRTPSAAAIEAHAPPATTAPQLPSNVAVPSSEPATRHGVRPTKELTHDAAEPGRATHVASPAAPAASPTPGARSSPTVTTERGVNPTVPPAKPDEGEPIHIIE